MRDPSKEGEDIVRYSSESRRSRIKSLELTFCKRDLEFAYVGASNAQVTGNNSGPTAREMASADQLIDATTTEAGGTAALTEAMLLSVGQKVFNEGGDASVFMIKPADAQIVAGFTGASGRYRNFNDAQKTLTNVIDLYVKNVA